VIPMILSNEKGTEDAEVAHAVLRHYSAVVLPATLILVKLGNQSS
jgi:hypothetical protein